MTQDRKSLKTTFFLDRSKTIVFILLLLLILMVAKVYIAVQKDRGLIDDIFVFEIVLFSCLLIELIFRKKVKDRKQRILSYARQVSTIIFLIGFIILAIIDFGLYVINGNGFINIYLIFMFLIFVGSLIDWIVQLFR